MKPALWVVISGFVLVSCASQTEWRTEDALAADKVEVQVDGDGRALEIEYHVSPDVVPAAVHTAMDTLHPGGQAIGGEKEFIGSQLFWELSKVIDGREVEAMFHPDGTLRSEEAEVAVEDVPDEVRAAVAARLAGTVRKWETVRDSDRALIEYHAKVDSDGRQYKLVVSTDGEILRVVRELLAEIEVPVESP